MIELKYYREKDGRDTNIYLGIDRSPIPINLFKGIFSEAGNVYSESIYGEVQFVVSDDEKFVNLVGVDDDAYITIEDVQSTDQWVKVGHVLSEFSTFGMPPMNENSPHHALLKKYYSGETGLLQHEVKKFNAKGEYMREHRSFDTQPFSKDEDIRSTLLRHVDLVYYDEPLLPWEERNLEVRGNSKNIAEVVTLLVGPLTDSISTEMLTLTPGCELSFKLIGIPPFGNMEFVVDETIKSFIVRKKRVRL